jgi:hypothetical protein
MANQRWQRSKQIQNPENEQLSRKRNKTCRITAFERFRWTFGIFLSIQAAKACAFNRHFSHLMRLWTALFPLKEMND